MRLSYENIWIRNCIIYVFLFSIIYIANYTTEDKDPLYMFVELIVVFTFVYGLVLVNNLFLIRPFLLYQKKYNLFFIGFALLWSFFLVVAKITHYIMEETISIFNDIMGIIMISLIGSGIYFIHQWILQNIFKTQIKLLNTEAELSLLKQQMNPHFLLNAMNNLYGDALMAPETLPDKILKLSELLRYQIEATKKDFISLSEEMHFIEQYLGYHTYRSHNLSVKEEHNGSGNDLKVPPFIFYAFGRKCREIYTGNRPAGYPDILDFPKKSHDILYYE
ncbi:histidine kinase [Flavobacterium kingsejongi]|uniref:Signal transduction histidine kinase internal region domain-containing protein n=1 Tax=Flavobacterium kingsejongi TaxID=1678728 RepID=A0A2S1LTJ9_9FLAO|nr:sensor histidine kinase [Flavobacterium kingsejongi]AWG27002.1 hypothetical protein FK004_18065 [Flavobacterium kingsejongi]